MEIINPWMLYLVLQADEIKNAVGTTSMLFAACAAAAGLITCMIQDLNRPNPYDTRENERSLWEVEKLRLQKRAKRAAIACVAFTLTAAASNLIPSSKDMAVLMVLPAIANNEAVQSEAREIYDLAKQGLKDLVGDDSRSGAEQQ